MSERSEVEKKGLSRVQLCVWKRVLTLYGLTVKQRGSNLCHNWNQKKVKNLFNNDATSTYNVMFINRWVVSPAWREGRKNEQLTNCEKIQLTDRQLYITHFRLPNNHRTDQNKNRSIFSSQESDLFPMGWWLGAAVLSRHILVGISLLRELWLIRKYVNRPGRHYHTCVVFFEKIKDIFRYNMCDFVQIELVRVFRQ